MDNNKGKKISIKKNIFPILILLSICFLSIGYAKISDKTLIIDGDALATVQDGIFISSATFTDSSGGTGTVGYYYSNLLNSTATLSSDDTTSYVTYTITIYNSTSSSSSYLGVTYGDDFYGNDDITFTVEGLEVGYELESGASVTFTLTFTYIEGLTEITDNVLESYLSFNFGEIDNKELISETESYVGYYADVNGDKVVDGIIYADLMQAPTGWGSSMGSYSWTTITSAKEYTISEETYSGIFGEKEIITAVNGSEGNERFYVMALEDVDGNSYLWYCNAYNNRMSDYMSTTSEDFGTGYKNTGTMISYWNNETYGKQNEEDIWGLDAVQQGYDNGWYVPSSAEWSAFLWEFCSEIGITDANFYDYDLQWRYWSSSQYSTTYAYFAEFDGRMVKGGSVTQYCYVRLGTTF